MPVLLDIPAAPRPDALAIGLVNNMPDAALQATERQFTTLIGKAAGDRPVRLHLFALPGVERGPEAARMLAERYASTKSLPQTPLDALIVTGCEPRASALTDEPFWPDFARLVDWATANTVSTFWSCLAAHAAVLHLDGIARHRLPHKRTGIFACEGVRPHALLAGARGPFVVPHSRWNDLREPELEARGYTVLTRSPEAGVDLFVKEAGPDGGSLLVFFQGHPEYEPDSIAREYRRDVARFLRGERDDYPGMPHGYFDPATEATLQELRARALADRRNVALKDLPRHTVLRDGLSETWQESLVPVFANWLAWVAAKRAAPSSVSHQRQQQPHGLADAAPAGV